jgi:hypothetical protein
MNLCVTAKPCSECLLWVSAPQTIKCKQVSCCSIAVASTHSHSRNDANTESAIDINICEGELGHLF